MSDYRESIDEFEKRLGTTEIGELVYDGDRSVGKNASDIFFAEEQGSVSTDSKLYSEPKKVIVRKYKLSK